ncbi:hypothetical protein [Metabacillus iocasae]|uniref:YuzL family protein n=1 Tax=Priestia iocasae TaxID=2291674 RepID=A0ABS2QRV9_9BACI|nr:hypothetical protein [Metabacillus iocasae]MBM7702186.1 hypothetical protein [Metabacillus iocasae]
MTKRNRKQKAGLQSVKSVAGSEFSKELATSKANQKAEKTRPN